MSRNLYPELARLLREAGCEFVRTGKGSHEVWRTPAGSKLTIPRGIENRHTANGILKQAGLPKSF